MAYKAISVICNLYDYKVIFYENNFHKVVMKFFYGNFTLTPLPVFFPILIYRKEKAKLQKIIFLCVCGCIPHRNKYKNTEVLYSLCLYLIFYYLKIYQSS